MSINSRYFEYLDHFGQTVTVAELNQDRHRQNAIALRHDVDYDLDFALEMSYWEKQVGIRSTYFLLHTAPYWNDPRLIDKCLQIQDFGHEIGLHVNVVTEWFNGTYNDPTQRLDQLLDHLRRGGVSVTGISAHGDRACYENGFINYWLFKELRPASPEQEESGRTAEGIRLDDPKFQIKYPPNHLIQRRDGKKLRLWSISMKHLRLDYHAWHVPHDEYYSDSGGGWNRTNDPLERDLSKGRIEILMHPLYWRGQQKFYFFLSTARAGSKWLTNFLDQSTSVTARHEFMLNHRYENGKLIPEKRTGVGFSELVNSSDDAKELLGQARAYLESRPGDQAEVNVYLDRFIPLVKQIFPEADIVHLCRDPKDVIRSILNRDWYDTPEDRRHPALPVERWDVLSQFEKACWYVRLTNQTLLEASHSSLVFERMVHDLEYLTERLREMGIAVYPRLAAPEHAKKINVGRKDLIPAYDQWLKELVRTYHRICDPILKDLGYSGARASSHGQNPRIYDESLNSFLRAGAPDAKPQVIVDRRYIADAPNDLFLVGCGVQPQNGCIEVTSVPQRHAHVMFAGGTWNRLRKGAGWMHQHGYYYRGTLSAKIDANESALFCLIYDRDGELMEKRSLQQLRPRQTNGVDFTFRVRSDASRFNLALYIPKSEAPTHIQLQELKLEMLPLFDRAQTLPT
jgi:hypothetical protein